MVTTIQLAEKTKEKLEKLKEYPRETFDELVSKLIELAGKERAMVKSRTGGKLKEKMMKSFGAWKGMDTDKLIKEIYENRRKQEIREVGF